MKRCCYGITKFKFIEKRLFCSLFLIQNIAKSLTAPVLKNILEWMLLKMCSRN